MFGWVIESAVERLEELAAEYADDYWGAPMLPAASETDIAQIEALVWPSRIPEEVLRFWRFRSGGPISDVLCGIELQGPRECGENYIVLGDEPFRHPKVLLPLGYGYQLWLCVELATNGCDGGALWRVVNDDSGMCEIYPSLGCALEFAVAEMKRLGRRPEFEENVERYLGSRTFAVEGLDQYMPLAWPLHWRELQGVSPADMRPVGATTTVSGVIAGTATEPWIITGTVKMLGGSGAGNVGVLQDSTGQIEFVATGKADPACVLLGKDPVEIELRRRDPSQPTMTTDEAEAANDYARDIAIRAGLPAGVVGDFAANLARAAGGSAYFEAVRVRPTSNR